MTTLEKKYKGITIRMSCDCVNKSMSIESDNKRFNEKHFSPNTFSIELPKNYSEIELLELTCSGIGGDSGLKYKINMFISSIENDIIKYSKNGIEISFFRTPIGTNLDHYSFKITNEDMLTQYISHIFSTHDVTVFCRKNLINLSECIFNKIDEYYADYLLKYASN